MVLSGAGVSVSSGIPDFRSPGSGLYANMEEYDASDQAGFKHWRIRVATLLGNADSRIGSLLSWAVKQKEAISRSAEIGHREMETSGLDVAEVSEKIFRFLVQALNASNDDMVDQAQNRGLELWRMLHDRFEHRADTALWNMLTHAQNPPRCKSIDHLIEALEEWEEFVRKCAGGGHKFQMNDYQKEMALTHLAPSDIETTFENNRE